MHEHIVAVGPDLPGELAVCIKDALDLGLCERLHAHLEKMVDLEISGILVYGGLAGRAPPREIGNSDVDLLVLTKADAVGGVFGTAAGIQVDLHIQQRESTLADPKENWVFAEAEVLYDTDPPLLKSWLESLREWMARTPDPWSRADRLRGKVWAYRLLQRVERLKQSDPTLATLHEARLLAGLPELHAQAQQRRTTSISQWYRSMLLDDPGMANALQAYDVDHRHGDPGALRRLLDHLFENGTALRDA
jgi:hypothetical protein